MEKKHFKNLLWGMVFLVSVLMPQMAWADSYSGHQVAQPEGEGIEENPYLITSADELYWFAQKVNEGDNVLCAKLMDDIVVNDGTFDLEGKYTNETSSTPYSWTPIGNENNKYYGSFDGNNHTIKGLYFKNPNQSYVGFIGRSSDNSSYIKNLGIIDSYFYGDDNVGALCGSTGSVIDNCYSTGVVRGYRNDDCEGVGGLCGYSTLSITNSHSSCTVISNGYAVGGLCGHGSGTINGCYATGNVSGYYEVGGLCGYGEMRQLEIKNCYATGDVSESVSANSYLGGICGFTAFIKISNCYSTCNFSSAAGSNAKIGGICGYYGLETISNCYTTYNSAIGEDCGSTTQTNVETNVTLARFQNGDITKALNDKKATDDASWAQDLGKKLPNLSNAAYCYSRDIKAKWNTICLPFAAQSTEDTKFYVIESLTGGLITLKFAETLAAGNPALVNTTSNPQLFIPATGKDLVSDPVNASGTNCLVGTFKDITVPVDDNNYFFGLSANKGTYVQVKSAGVPLGAYRAYIKCSKADGAAGLRQVIADEDINETAISDVVDTLNDSEAQYFDMNGRKMNGLQKGLNIISKNGKRVKVLVK